MARWMFMNMNIISPVSHHT